MLAETEGMSEPPRFMVAARLGDRVNVSVQVETSEHLRVTSPPRDFCFCQH